MKKISKQAIGWIVLVIGIYAIVELLIQIGILNRYYQITLVTIGINIILAIGLNMILGVAGQFSLGHAGFMSIGAYACAIMTLKMPTPAGFIIGIIFGIVIASIVALIVALPTLRLKGDYLAIATLGVAEIIRIIMINGGSLTNEAAGLSGIPKMTNWTLIYVIIVITIILTVNYVKSGPGRATVAIREDEIAAESMGVNTTKYKTVAFVLGALIASVGGSLYASYFSIIKPNDFGFMRSVDILIIVVFGGIGSTTGTILAAILLGIINTFLQSFGALRMILYALALIIIMIFRPEGLLGRKEFTMTWFFNLFHKDMKREEE